ncbi:hypothetical protein MKJ04_21285 [Pontibacter sp. E15-1]|uniref:hypothetical protein n=1 Tax=Pontibacter sp. E15-1 TaxID=2919918 RepID=UPI001F500F86|nr:hypothetical protein [Pontibacter sp. E15-1]MCJ8167389.1 hypothetical protein [Pontibacter sp. E15-1]
MVIENEVMAGVPVNVSTVTENASGCEELSFSFLEEQEILFVNWTGLVPSKEMRKGYIQVLKQVQHYKARKILLDLNKRSFIDSEDQRWVFSSVFPKMLRSIGANVFVAIVLPVDLFHDLVAELEGDELIHNNHFMIIQHSLYKEEALRWLNKVPYK